MKNINRTWDADVVSKSVFFVLSLCLRVCVCVWGYFLVIFQQVANCVRSMTLLYLSPEKLHSVSLTEVVDRVLISILKFEHSTGSFLSFMKRKGTCILYEIWGAEPCAVQKATGPSGDQNKRQNWAIVSICCPGEGEGAIDRWIERERELFADTDWIIVERERNKTNRGQEEGQYEQCKHLYMDSHNYPFVWSFPDTLKPSPLISHQSLILPPA